MNLFGTVAVFFTLWGKKFAKKEEGLGRGRRLGARRMPIMPGLQEAEGGLCLYAGRKKEPGAKKARYGAFHTGRALQADAVSPSGRGGEVLAD